MDTLGDSSNPFVANKGISGKIVLKSQNLTKIPCRERVSTYIVLILVQGRGGGVVGDRYVTAEGLKTYILVARI